MDAGGDNPPPQEPQPNMIATLALVLCAASFAAALRVESSRFSGAIGSIHPSSAAASQSALI